MSNPKLACLLFLVLVLPDQARGSSDFWSWFSIKSMPERLDIGLARLDSGGSLLAFGDTLSRRRNPDLTAFYALRGGSPAWFAQGQPIPAAWQLLDAVRKCPLEGLEPGDYHAVALDTLLSRSRQRTFWQPGMAPGKAAQLELLLTDAYLLLARHMLYGRVRPKIPAGHWHVGRETIDLPVLLDQTIRRRIDIRVSLQSLAPPQLEYGKMKYWLAEYRALEAKGNWPAVPDDRVTGRETLENRAAAALCGRLQATGELAAGDCPETLTPELEDALRKFQSRHGLDPTGKMDAGTLRQLNAKVADRIVQIALNLEFWRWLPRDLGERHVRINIADYRLAAFENGSEIFDMRVVVGRKEDSTPVFSDSITFVQVNPSWNVPASIAVEEMLPEIRKDPEYLAKHDMELLANWSKHASVIRPDSIDWEEVDEENFPFRVRQKNGDASALGRIKFQLTNPFNIYLHDTPAKKYFERDKRALSHGCVRLAEPMKLAVWVLEQDSSIWTPERLETVIAEGKETYIPVPRPAVKAHILYWTCFVDGEGGLQFRPDIYRWERRIAAAILRKAATF